VPAVWDLGEFDAAGGECGQVEREAFCSPYMNMRGQGRERNFVIRLPLSERSTMDSKMPRTAPGRTLCRRLAA
jgi:hypothetical protein